MTETIKPIRWECNICGSSSMDSDENRRSLDQHLHAQHNLTLEEYNRLVDKDKIGCSHLNV